MSLEMYESVVAALSEVGLAARGAFHPEAEDGVPALPDGRPVATLVLAGNVGPNMFQAFSAARDGWTAEDDGGHPLDHWSRLVLTKASQRFGGSPDCVPIYSFDGPPYHPFQRWARKSEAVHPSPLGPFIHPDYGLWQAYRGSLAFAENFAVPPRDERPNPCATCRDRPCMSTCPVEAHSGKGLDLLTCVRHMDGPDGEDCIQRGCQARRACPVSPEFLYRPEQANFHMDSFTRLRKANFIARGLW